MKIQIPITHQMPAFLAGILLSSGVSQAALTAYDGFGSPTAPAIATPLAPYAPPGSGTGIGGQPGGTFGALLWDRPLATSASTQGLGFPGKWIEPLPTPPPGGTIGTFTTRFFRYGRDYTGNISAAPLPTGIPLGSTSSWMLNYPGLLSNNSGGALIYGSDYSYGQFNRASRLLGTPFTGASTGTHYVSFLMRKNNAGTSYIGFEMLSGGGDSANRTFQFGGSVDTSADTGKWGMRVNNISGVDIPAVGTAAQSDVTVVENETVLVVMKLVLSATAASDSVTLWVNPSDLAVEANSGPGVTLSGIDFAADRIALASYTYAGDWCFFDEYRMGTAWGDVLPGPSVEQLAPAGVASQYAVGAIAENFRYKLFATNRPLSFTVTGTLPDGLTLNSATGVISGTPTTVGVSALAFTATNSIGTSASVPFTIEVVTVLNRRELIGGALTAVANNSATASSHSNSDFPTPAAYDRNTTTDHAVDSMYNNRLVVDLGAGNERILTGFRFFPRSSSGGRAFGGEVQTSIDGLNFTKVGTINFTPVPGTWNTVPITFSAKGRYFRYFHPGRTDIAEIEFRAYSNTPAPPVIAPSLAATLSIADPSRFILVSTNEPTAWIDVSPNTGNNRLPTGMTFDNVTGQIIGEPTEAGVFTPSFTATNADGTSPAQSVTITVIPSALIVYEGFEYNLPLVDTSVPPDGIGDVDINNALATFLYTEIIEGDPIDFYTSLNGGTGWSNAWATFSQEPLAEPGLTKGDLMVSGKRVLQGNNGNQRDFTPQAPTGIYWFNVLMTVLDEPVQDIAYGLNIQKGSGGEATTLLSVGYNYAQYKIQGAAVPTVNMPNTVLADGSTKMFTIRLNMFTNTMHAWVDATPGTVAPSDASAINPAGTTFTPFTFDRIRFSAFGPAGEKAMDEIRIGKTFAQVAPVALAGTALDTFRTANGLAADGTQDLLTPAGDGVSNLLKFAFNMIGGSPGQASSLSIPNVATFNGTAGLPLVGRQVGTGKLQITYLRRKAASNPGAIYTVQFSNDLGIANPWLVNGLATEEVTSIDSVFEQVVVTDDTAVARRFARVRVIGE